MRPSAPFSHRSSIPRHGNGSLVSTPTNEPTNPRATNPRAASPRLPHQNIHAKSHFHGIVLPANHRRRTCARRFRKGASSRVDRLLAPSGVRGLGSGIGDLVCCTSNNALVCVCVESERGSAARIWAPLMIATCSGEANARDGVYTSVLVYGRTKYLQCAHGRRRDVGVSVCQSGQVGWAGR